MSQAMPGANRYVVLRFTSVPRYRESPCGRPVLVVIASGARPPAPRVLSVSTFLSVQSVVTPAPTVKLGVTAYATLAPTWIRPYLSYPMATPGFRPVALLYR